MSDICIYDYDEQCFHECENCPQYKNSRYVDFNDDDYEDEEDEYD